MTDIGRTGMVMLLQEQWKQDPKGVSIDLLRIGIGIVWALDLIFILDPQAQYFSTFQAVAQSYGTQSLGGPLIANFVAAHALFFAWLIALASAYLAVALLLGVTTRLACGVGIVASLFFFVTQFTMTFMFPGGTDVGAHPLYILIYLVLVAGGAGKYLSVDGSLPSASETPVPGWFRWLFTPEPRPSGSTEPEDPDGTHPTPRGLFQRRPYLPGLGTAAVLLCVLTIAMVGVQAGQTSVANDSSSNSNSNVVTIIGSQYTLLYPNNAASGGFGTTSQDGCFECRENVSLGGVANEEEMLTNDGATPLTIDSMVVAPPFALTSGPEFPMTEPAHGGMAMFVINVRAPTTPGNFDLNITFSIS